jgi:hypothetical protein
VADESPETVEVDFFGALAGSATPDASGYFEFSADADWLGDIGVVAYDDESLSSDSEFAEVTSDAPMIDSLSVEYGEGTDVTVIGQVIDDSADGLTIEVTGAVAGMVTTDSSGYFTFTAEGSSGDVDVSVTDAWGQNSCDSTEIEDEEPQDPIGGDSTEIDDEVSEDPIGGDSTEIDDEVSEDPIGGSYPLEIIDFGTDMDSGGYISVWGTVTGENCDQATIVLTFLDVENELSADSDGYFSWYYQCARGDEGWITVVATDDSTNASDTVEDYQGYIIYT